MVDRAWSLVRAASTLPAKGAPHLRDAVFERPANTWKAMTGGRCTPLPAARNERGRSTRSAQQQGCSGGKRKPIQTHCSTCDCWPATQLCALLHAWSWRPAFCTSRPRSCRPRPTRRRPGPAPVRQLASAPRSRVAGRAGEDEMARSRRPILPRLSLCGTRGYGKEIRQRGAKAGRDAVRQVENGAGSEIAKLRNAGLG